jgi:heptosyltransferase-2
MKLESVHKILFITLSNVGDVILTLPVLSALKDNFQGAKIDVVVGPRPKEIFTKDPGINRVFVYDKHTSLKEKVNFIRKLRSEKYDLAVDIRSSLIPFLIGAKKRSSLIMKEKAQARHKKSVHLSRLEKLGVKYKDRQNIYIDNKDREIVHRLLEERGIKKGDVLIGVSPACRSLLKQWRAEGFVEVINELLKEENYKIVLIGDSSQANISQRIVDAVGHKNLVDLTGKTDLNQLFALIEKMYFLLTCDSACLHIACDLGVKVVAIFGPTDPQEYGPTGQYDIVVQKNLKCAPCNRATCRFNHECMEQIKAVEVLEAVRNIVGRKAEAKPLSLHFFH